MNIHCGYGYPGASWSYMTYATSMICPHTGQPLSVPVLYVSFTLMLLVKPSGTSGLVTFGLCATTVKNRI